MKIHNIDMRLINPQTNEIPPTKTLTRRRFFRQAGAALAGAGLIGSAPRLFAQSPGERPARARDVTGLNPRARVPVGLIIDDSTCLVNLNRFSIPQFDEAFGHGAAAYQRNWREWPLEIPDSFVRKFGEWCAEHGVKGKYSIVPFPGCVGRLDRILPGWTPAELRDSIKLVRELMMPNWDIHPEMVTHTRVIDLKTGHPYEDHSLKFMENWEWTTGRSADEIGEYMAYALRILKNIGLPCEGITTPGGFGNKALPQLAQGTLQAVRSVFGAEIPHYFRHLYDRGNESVAPRVEYASGLDGPDPRCVVSIIGCTGDWTGGWDNTPPGGVDKFITADLQSGRMVDVIARGEPGMMLAHWTGVYWNGQELGFKVFQEVVRRLHAKYDNLVWMKLSEVSRYWAAKELTRIERNENRISFLAPFAAPDFTVKFTASPNAAPRRRVQNEVSPLKEVSGPLKLAANTWCREGAQITACFALPKGASQLEV
jgi:hypothetical protein